MSDQVSAVTIAEPKYAPGRYIIIRSDFPELDHKYVWCGRSLGWLPKNLTTRLYQESYRSVDEAAEVAERYITWPLQE